MVHTPLSWGEQGHVCGMETGPPACPLPDVHSPGGVQVAPAFRLVLTCVQLATGFTTPAHSSQHSAALYNITSTLLGRRVQGAGA